MRLRQGVAPIEDVLSRFLRGEVGGFTEYEQEHGVSIGMGRGVSALEPPGVGVDEPVVAEGESTFE